jgi:PKD repeat protein
MVSDAKSSNTATVIINVTNENEAPEITDIDNQLTDEDTILSIPFAVTDVESDALTITVKSSNASKVSEAGSLTINGTNSALYTIAAGSSSKKLTLEVMPLSNENGAVTLTIVVSDSGALTDFAEFALTISPVNDSPTIADTSADLTENSADGYSVVTVHGSDIEGDTLTYTITSGDENNAFTINNSGEIKVNKQSELDYESENKSYTLTVMVSDGSLSATATVMINLIDENEEPTITLINNLSSNEYAQTNPIPFTVLDEDGDALNIQVTSSNATVVAIDTTDITLCHQTCENSKTITLSASNALQQLSLTIMPAKDGVADITVTVSDGELSASSSFKLTVINVNITPVISSIADTSMDEDLSKDIGFTVYDADCDGRNVTLTVVTDNSSLLPTNANNISIASNGLTYSLNADQSKSVTLSVTPLSNQFGSCGITITVTDANNATATSHFTLTVNKLEDDSPELSTISNDTIDEDNTHQTTVDVMDHDGGQLAISVQSSNTDLVPVENVVISGANYSDPNLTTTAHETETLTLTITPLANANGSVSITIVANDGTNPTGESSFTLTVTPVDDDPVIAQISDFDIDEDTSGHAVSFTIVDVDGGNLSLSAKSNDQTLISDSNLTFSSSSVSTTAGFETTITLYVSTQLNANGDTTASVTVTDPSGLTDSTNFTITVNPVNDPPSMTNITNQSIFEDHPTAPIALNISDIEHGELTISASTSDTDLPITCLTFAGDQIGSYEFTTVSDGESKPLTLVILPPLNINNNFTSSGNFDITLTVADPEGLSDTKVFSLDIEPVNDMPLYTLSKPLTANEDDPTQFKEEWITGISAGAVDETEPLTFIWSVVDDNNVLVKTESLTEGVDIAVSGTTAKIIFTPETDAHGVAILTIALTDGYSTTANQAYNITINEVNDKPSFTKGEDQIKVGNVGHMYEVQNWATEIDLGPADEYASGQFATFVVDAEKDALFAGGPIITSDGTLKYTPIEKAYGVSDVYVYLSDNGTGEYTSGMQTFTIDISSINSQPSFSTGSDITVNEDSGVNLIAGWATNITTGHKDESEQSIEFSITATNAGIFSVPPAIQYIQGETTADLVFTTESNANGTATLYITMKDSGGTVDGGSDTYNAQTVTITITPVNDKPSFVKGKDLKVKADNQLRTEENWATEIKAGPGNEDQTVSFSLSADPDIFSTDPAIDNHGTLTYRPSTTGTSTVTVTLTDEDGAFTSTTFIIETTATAAPEISAIDDQHLAQDTLSAKIALDISDDDTSDGNLALTPTSNNTTLIPDDYIIIEGTGTNRTVSLSPTTGEFGNAIITIEVSDGISTVSESFALTVYERPEVSIDVAGPYSATNGTVPLSVQFTPTIVKGNANEITGWNWAFGDGSTSTDRTPIHTYVLSDEGDASYYTVTLTVIGLGGSSTATEASYITVNALKYADFMATTNRSGIFPLTVCFADISNSITGTRKWDVDGDNVFEYSDTMSITHTYTSPGLYTVTLNVGEYTETKIAYVNIYGLTITGKVTNSDESENIANVIVDVHSSRNVLKGSAVTDSEGDFIITDLPAASGLIISAWPAYTMTQYLPQYYNEKETRQEADRQDTLGGKLTGINFKLLDAPTNAISGRITDTTAGEAKGLSNVIVEVYSSSLDFYKSAVTDANGDYMLTALKSGDDYVLSVYDDRYATEFFYHATEDSVTARSDATRLTPTDPTLTGIDIVIALSNTISGQVKDDKGKVVSGIWVQAQDVNNSFNTRSVRTDENGLYTLTGLDRDVKHYVEILATAYPYQAYNLSTTRALATKISIAEKNTDIDFILQTGSDIRGRVTNSKNVMLNGVMIYAQSSTKGIQTSTMTNEAGQYTLTNLPYATDYIIYADATDAGNYPLQYYSLASTSDNARYVSLAKGDLNNVNFVLDKGAVIHGNVRIGDTTTSAGQGIMVNIYSDSTQTGGTVATDANGVFEIAGLNQNANDYIVSIWEEGYLPAFYDGINSTTVYNIADAKGMAPSSNYINIVLKQGHSVCGTVSAVNNSLVSSFTVELWSETTNGYAITQVSGNNLAVANYCVQNVSSGEYEAMIHASGFADQAANVTVNGDRSDVNFVLDLPSRAIGGTVKNIKTGRQVQISACSNSLIIDKCKSMTVSGNGDVGYTIDGLKPASDYVLELWSSSYPKQVYNGQTQVSKATVVNVMSNNQSGINFTLPDNIPEISGTITFPDTGNVSGDSVAVQAFSDNGTAGSTTVKFTGNKVVSYRITGLSPITDYKVSVWSNKYKLQYYKADCSGQEDCFAFTKASGTPINTSDATPDDQINFKLTTGRKITGLVLKTDGTPVGPGVYVEAQSLSNINSWTGATTENDGTYLLGGLDDLSDYIVSAKKTDIPRAYYNKTGSVQVKSLAEPVSLTAGDAENITITIQTGLSIKGTIRNTLGRSIFGVWVSASSETKGVGSGVYSAIDGSFTIKGLPAANDYVVKAVPQPGQSYIKLTKTGVSAGTTGVDFVLKQGFTMSGSVIAESSGKAITRAEITLSSASNAYLYKGGLNASGQFEISGLLSGTDYVLTVKPDATISYVKKTLRNITITANTLNMLIQLTRSVSIEGKVQLAGTSESPTPVNINNAWVSVYSSLKGTGGNDWTDNNGYFNITNIPDASDYVLTVSHENYPERKVDVTIGQEILVELSTGGKISGMVRTESGPLAGVAVELWSDSLPLFRNVLTDSNGNFVFNGIPVTKGGFDISDYEITVDGDPVGYPDKTKTGLSAGDSVIITLQRTLDNEISGTVSDANGNLVPADKNVTVYVYTAPDWGYVKAIAVTPGTGAFKITGLETGEYWLVFYTSDGTLLGYDQYRTAQNIAFESDNALW